MHGLLQMRVLTFDFFYVSIGYCKLNLMGIFMNKKILDIVNDVDFILFDMSLEQRGIIFTMLLQHINDKPINTDSDLFVGADENDLSISMAVYRMIVYMAEK